MTVGYQLAELRKRISEHREGDRILLSEQELAGRESDICLASRRLFVKYFDHVGLRQVPDGNISKRVLEELEKARDNLTLKDYKSSVGIYYSLVKEHHGKGGGTDTAIDVLGKSLAKVI